MELFILFLLCIISLGLGIDPLLFIFCLCCILSFLCIPVGIVAFVVEKKFIKFQQEKWKKERSGGISISEFIKELDKE